jgi:hypothetical protein
MAESRKAHARLAPAKPAPTIKTSHINPEPAPKICPLPDTKRQLSPFLNPKYPNLPALSDKLNQDRAHVGRQIADSLVLSP